MMVKSLVLLVMVMGLTNSLTNSGQYFTLFSGSFCSDYYSVEMFLEFKVHCAQQCQMREDCFGFCYNEDLSKCTVHGVTNMANSSTLQSGVWFKIYNSEVTKEEAASLCKEVGGHISLPTSSSSNSALNSLAKSDGVQELWLGMEKKSGDFFADSNGKAVPYKNLASFESWDLFTSEYCAYQDKYGEWRDVKCNSEYAFVCQNPGPMLCTDEGRDYENTPEKEDGYICYKKHTSN